VQIPEKYVIARLTINGRSGLLKIINNKFKIVFEIKAEAIYELHKN